MNDNLSEQFGRLNARDSPQRKLRSPLQKSYMSYKVPCEKVKSPISVKKDNRGRLSKNELEEYQKEIFKQYVYAKQCQERRSQHRKDFFPDPADWDTGHTSQIKQNKVYEQAYLKELGEITNIILDMNEKEEKEENHKESQDEKEEKQSHKKSSYRKGKGKKGSKQRRKTPATQQYVLDPDAYISVIESLEADEEVRLAQINRKIELIGDLIMDTMARWFGSFTIKDPDYLRNNLYPTLVDVVTRTITSNRVLVELSEPELVMLQEEIRDVPKDMWLQIIDVILGLRSGGLDTVLVLYNPYTQRLVKQIFVRSNGTVSMLLESFNDKRIDRKSVV